MKKVVAVLGRTILLTDVPNMLMIEKKCNKKGMQNYLKGYINGSFD